MEISKELIYAILIPILAPIWLFVVVNMTLTAYFKALEEHRRRMLIMLKDVQTK